MSKFISRARTVLALALAFGLAGTTGCTDTAPPRAPSLSLSPSPSEAGAEGPQVHAMHAFIAKRKFEPTVFNPVQRSEPERQHLQAIIDALATRLLPLADHPRDKARVLAEFLHSMSAIDLVESEDKEQAAGYMQEIMGILDISSSEGLLDNWVYGFDPKDARRVHGAH